MSVKWTDSDGAFEGSFVVDIEAGTWELQGAGTITIPVASKGVVRTRTYVVPNLTGTIRQSWPGFGGRLQFRGLIDKPGFSTFRMDEVFGGFDHQMGDVEINYFGYKFRISGWVEADLSGAEPSIQTNNK